jgi:hypothetical protein
MKQVQGVFALFNPLFVGNSLSLLPPHKLYKRKIKKEKNFRRSSYDTAP